MADSPGLRLHDVLLVQLIYVNVELTYITDDGRTFSPSGLSPQLTAASWTNAHTFYWTSHLLAALCRLLASSTTSTLPGSVSVTFMGPSSFDTSSLFCLKDTGDHRPGF